MGTTIGGNCVFMVPYKFKEHLMKKYLNIVRQRGLLLGKGFFA
jgi:hypothetical protein